MLREEPPPNVDFAVELVDMVLNSAQQALCTVIHRTLGVSPGSIAFGRDMLLPIPLLTDYNLIRERRQAQINQNLIRENNCRIFHDYQVGEQVLLKIYDPATLQERAQGPYPIEQVHVNGTLTIRLGDNVLERINIRRIEGDKFSTQRNEIF